MNISYIRIFSIVFLLLPLISFSQKDCESAIMISNGVISESFSKGFGKKNELPAYKLFPGKSLTENNSHWYLYTASENGIFNLIITPEQPFDDIDFMLFKSDDGKCENLNLSKVVRSNFARTSNVEKGVTGLSVKANSENTGPGPGDPFSKNLYMQKEEQFYLMIDNINNDGKAYTIEVNFISDRTKEDEKRAELEKQKQSEARAEEQEYRTTFKVAILDSATNEKVKAAIEISGISSGTVMLRDTSEFVFEGCGGCKYMINSNAPGYLFSSISFYGERIPENAVEIKLVKFRVGDKLTLREIYFEGDGDEILAKSKPALTNLRNFMIENPQVKIEIQGHVNAPEQKNSRRIKKFSRKRAVAVEEFLKMSGIEKNRIKTKGYGNEHMIHRNPVTEKQSEANRRVEIKITSN